ncbi:MAG: monovalent cation/H+ antiporter subunit D family protein [Dethiobacter sp.]|nr:MAG: monovalent cation/H+ antiporter subunit D family protein [Dethiobacter sp.]
MAIHVPVLLIVILLGASYSVPLLDRYRKNLAFPLTIASLSAVFVFSLYLIFLVGRKGPFFYHLGGWPPPWGIELSVDFLAVYMLMVLSSIGLLVMIYGAKDLRHELKKEVLSWYYTLYLLLIGSMMGIALTNDLFNMFVFIEISAIASCGIISIKEDRRCLEASIKYLILSVLGSGCVLLAVAMIYMVTGNLNFVYIAAELPAALALYPFNILIALSLFIVGLGVKSALFPLHVWLPDAHSSAPSPSSAVLSGLVIKIYAFALIKLLFRVFPPQIYAAVPVLDIILFLSVLAVLVGSIFAMVQDDIKRMLAYSSIAQIGYVFMGIGLFGDRALSGGLLHIFNHAMMKSMLFMAAGLIIYATGIRRIKDLKGIGVRMPWTMGAFTVGALSMVGIPGTSGFISKWYLALGALDLGRPFYVAIILLSSLLNGIYYFPIVIDAFFGTKVEPRSEHRDVPALMLVPVLILAAGVVIFGFFPGPLLNLIEKAMTR